MTGEPPQSTPTRRFRPRHRLGRDLDYRAVFNARLRKGRGPMTVFARPNGLGYDRLGLSVGRKAGPATRRTRLKRLVRESFRLSRDRLPGGFDLIVNLRAHKPLPFERYRDLLVELCAAAAKEQARRDRKREGSS
ncbi:MAG: ribonuclease P protein component [Planctomycetota bacterium]